MGWFGGGSSDSSGSSEASFTDDAALTMGDPSLDSAAGSSSLGGAAGGGMGEFQQFSVALQQQILVQQVITNLTDQAFAKCITSKPSDSLSGSQVACVHAITNKWMDTNDFLMGRMGKKQQQQQQQGSFS